MTVIVGDIVEAQGSNPKKAQKSSQKVFKNRACNTSYYLTRDGKSFEF